MEQFLTDGMMFAFAGMAGGLVLGLAARIGRFCTLGAIEDVIYGGDDTRARMWGLAIAVAMAATFGLVAMGHLDLSQTIYHSAPFSPVAAILGGTMFGYGMALSGNCGFGALARIGGGDIRAFVMVLVLGVASYVALSGPLASARLLLVDVTSIAPGVRSYSDALEHLTGLPAALWGLAIATLLAMAILRAPAFRANLKAVFWGSAVGLAIASGFGLSAWLMDVTFGAGRVQGHTFSAPLGESLIYWMTSSAGSMTFATGSVTGVVVGAFAGSLFKGHFRWEACEDPRELKRQMIGAVLMGFGAALALGCTVGQGLSGIATLSLSSPLVIAGIVAGAALGLRQLIEGLASY
jgi:uncharacterized membrane protein YedE/YeeE